jgi:hypothetical protein
MKRALVLALSTCAAVAAAADARADWSAGAGFENFRWKESTAPTVKESGLRWALDLTWTQSREPGFSVAYNVRTYTGNVDYTGATLGAGTPISGETHYRGLTNEIQSIYRTTGGADFMLAAGWDRWNRDLTAAQTESYDVFYVRLGAAVGAKVRQGLLAGAGVKYPVYVRENAHLTDIGFQTNPRLRPRGDFSLYGSLGYRVSPGWDIIGYYDSYRFKQSNTVAVTDGTSLFTVFQPKSRQDVVGMKVQHNF